MAISFRGSREDLRRLLERFRDAVSGRGPDSHGVARGVQLRMGVALMSKIQQAFLVKSRGGTAEDGVRWEPLKRETVAQRRTTASERKSLGVGGKRTRGLLTPAQDKRWRAVFAGEKARLAARFGMGEGEASALAARRAWAILKSEGARTKLEALGGRQVDMLRDTGKLFRSFQPGVEDRPSGAEGQVMETPPGEVIVGSNVPYAAAQHARRPLWPKGGQLPPAWWDAVIDAGRRGIAAGVVRMLGGAT